MSVCGKEIIEHSRNYTNPTIVADHGEVALSGSAG